MVDRELNNKDEPFVLEPRDNHVRTIVALHGRGSTGDEFAAELFESQFSTGETLRDLLPGYKWVFPTCKPRLAAAFQEEITQWYEIYSLSDPQAFDEVQVEGIRDSIVQIKALVEREASLSPTQDVVLFGISQGFTIATLVALIGTPSIKALIGFSSWMPLHSVVSRLLSENSLDADLRSKTGHDIVTKLDCSSLLGAEFPSLLVFLAHCSDDTTVDMSLGHQLKDVLMGLGHRLTWCETSYGGHWINEPHGMNHLKQFLWLHELVNG